MKGEGEHPVMIDLASIKASPDCVRYYEDEPIDPLHNQRLSLYGLHPTAVLYLEISDGRHSRVQVFTSRSKVSPEERRQVLPLCDIADTFSRARILLRKWPRPGAAQHPNH